MTTRADGRFIEARLKNLNLQRGGQEILQGVNWTVRPGERWVLAGANGAGKTQLLKVLAGSVWPTPEGSDVRRYRWRGQEWHTPQELTAEMAYLGPERQDKYERYGWNHTVAQVVGTGIHRTDIPLEPLDAEARRRVAALLRRLRIAPLAARRFLTLSYGERRLVLLARALAARPRLLLLDELLNGLDTLNRARALRWLQSTAGTVRPWVLSVHRAEDVPAAATHVLILDQGRVVYRGARRRAPLRQWLAAGRSAQTVAAPVPRRSRGRGAVLVELQAADVYLDERCALRNLTFTVRAGECWVVHGRNGSGKTTLLRTLYGDYGVAVGGRIVRRGVEPGVPLETFRRRAALVAPHLHTDHSMHLSVAEVVQSGRYASIGLNDAPSAADVAAARRAMREFDVLPYARRTLRELSYGQLRRVLFARAWVVRPRLLLLDEPFAGLDALTQQALQARIGRCVADGAAVVIVVHRRGEWPQCATHELHLVGGALRYAGAVRLNRG
jgi:molybdate transport system ATP-binding protein